MTAPPAPASRTRASSARRVRLRDGSTVRIRPVRDSDEQALLGFLGGLGASSQRLRFFTAAADLQRAAHWAAAIDRERYGLVALDARGAIVGHALYVRLEDPTRAEVAVEVADELHGQGLGTILVELLAAAAERRGVVRFVAEVLPENRAMLSVFRDGFDAHVALRGGTDMVDFATSAWRLAQQRFGHGPGASGVCR